MAVPPQPKVNSEFVERYQLELQRNPRSRVFAPLSEAYRKLGFLEEAKRICRFGCEANPDFAGGHVAFAKILLDSKATPAHPRPQLLTEALGHLEKAAKLSPDNLLAHHLLGETLIELRKPKEALKAFKMVLFLDPDNERAKQAVKKWEFLTADEYGEDVFASAESVRLVPTAKAAKAIDSQLEELLTEDVSMSTDDSRLDLQRRHARALERAVSLADAFTVRNDLEAAVKVLEDARRLLGPMAEIENRYRLLSKRLEILSDAESDTEGTDIQDESRVTTEAAPPELAFDPPTLRVDRKRQILETLLRRINDRRA